MTLSGSAADRLLSLEEWVKREDADVNAAMPHNGSEMWEEAVADARAHHGGMLKTHEADRLEFHGPTYRSSYPQLAAMALPALMVAMPQPARDRMLESPGKPSVSKTVFYVLELALRSQHEVGDGSHHRSFRAALLAFRTASATASAHCTSHPSAESAPAVRCGSAGTRAAVSGRANPRRR